MDAEQNQRHKRTGNAKTIAKRLRSCLAELAKKKQRGAPMRGNGCSPMNHVMPPLIGEPLMLHRNGSSGTLSTMTNGTSISSRNSHSTLALPPIISPISQPVNGVAPLTPVTAVTPLAPISPLTPLSPVSSPDSDEGLSAQYNRAIFALANDFMANNYQIPSNQCIGSIVDAPNGVTDPSGFKTVYIVMAQQVPVAYNGCHQSEYATSGKTV